MNKKVITNFQKMIDVNTPIIYINDYDFVRIDEIIVEIVGNSKVFEWNPATGTTNFKTKESQGLGENDTLEQFLRYFKNRRNYNDCCIIISIIQLTLSYQLKQ